MYIKLKKLWHGHASVRDFLIRKAYEKGQNLTIEYRGEQMVISHKDLITSGKINNFVIQSKHNSESYHLIDYPWNPDARQTNLFQI